jgi:hypothetical protein
MFIVTSFSKLDSDPHSPKKLYTDPNKANADPKHWMADTRSYYYESNNTPLLESPA